MLYLISNTALIKLDSVNGIHTHLECSIRYIFNWNILRFHNGNQYSFCRIHTQFIQLYSAAGFEVFRAVLYCRISVERNVAHTLKNPPFLWTAHVNSFKLTVTRYCEGINNFEALRTYSISVTKTEQLKNDIGQLLRACFARETKCRTKTGHYKKCRNVTFVKKSCAYIRILSAQLLFFSHSVPGKGDCLIFVHMLSFCIEA